jgi:hypothetical protein
MLIWNGRIEPVSAAARADVAKKAETPTAAALARNSRRPSDEDIADMIFLPVGDATYDHQLMLRPQSASAPSILRKATGNARYAL